MSRTGLTFICVIASLTASAVTPQMVSDPANLKGAEYVNPVIHADYSDPDVVASPDGKSFYMTASSFQSVPGLPILKSEDLVNWAIVNYALPEVPPADFYAAAAVHYPRAPQFWPSQARKPRPCKWGCGKLRLHHVLITYRPAHVVNGLGWLWCAPGLPPWPLRLPGSCPLW